MWIAERGLKEVKYGNGKESRKLRVFSKDYLGMYPTNYPIKGLDFSPGKCYIET